MKHISLLWVAALLMFGAFAFAFHAFIREDGRQEPQYEERSERFQESASWTTIPDSVIELCMPAPLKKTPEIILRKKSYVVSYNQDTRMPNWVAWQLTAEHTDGELKRMNNFHEEENCPSPRATLQDYKGSGWSRGELRCRTTKVADGHEDICVRLVTTSGVATPCTIHSRWLTSVHRIPS